MLEAGQRENNKEYEKKEGRCWKSNSQEKELW